MIRKLVSVTLVLLCLASVASAQRAITFPHTENFNSTGWLSDLPWTSNGGEVSRVEQSWHGGGDYCAKIIPPNSTGGGINGDYASIGKFTFSSNAILNISFSIYLGTSLNSQVVNGGGGTYWKFVNVSNGTDWVAMGRFVQYSTYYEPSIVDYGGEQASVYWDGTADGGSTGGQTGRLFLGTGSVNQYDRAGEWLWMNLIFNATSDETTVRIYTRDGDYSGNYFVFPNGPAGNMSDFFINFFNGYFPARDANTYMLIDDLYVTNTASPHSVPSGFLTGEDTTDPTVTAFNIPSTAQSLTVAITEFTASDDVGVTGYCVNESASAPSAETCSGSGWAGSAQSSFTFASEGAKTLYAWAKDAAGNISEGASGGVTITLPTAANMVPVQQNGGLGVIFFNSGLSIN